MPPCLQQAAFFMISKKNQDLCSISEMGIVLFPRDLNELLHYISLLVGFVSAFLTA